MDIDSIGINGLLAALATELNVSLVLITENSNKTRNSVKEMRRALDLCFLAKSKGALPKDLGINLLLAKSKTGGELLDLTKGNVITVSEDRGFISDPKGHFKISVDFRENTILAAHYNKTGAGCDTVFKGKTAEAISKKIIKSGLVSSLEHASYLGRELQRAETYLKLKKSFIQDEEFAGL
jgi:dihydropteroate synthase-like protein